MNDEFWFLVFYKVSMAQWNFQILQLTGVKNQEICPPRKLGSYLLRLQSTGHSEHQVETLGSTC